MPAGWEVDEPDTVPDPTAEMPDDWDEDDDGEWEAAIVKNPKCSVGCGKWERPTIANPEYKGKWSAPMVDNPDYVGVWAPARIANPAFFTDATPALSLQPIGAVAIEVLANDRGFSLARPLHARTRTPAAPRSSFSLLSSFNSSAFQCRRPRTFSADSQKC